MADDLAPLDQQEDYDDLSANSSWHEGAILWSTDWTTETIISQLRKGNINLNPQFQRRNAWRDARKSKFIESLILGLPIPQIILAESKQKRGKYIVIDGKQRLLSIRQFVSSEGDEFDALHLRGLKDRPDLNRLSYAEFSTDPTLSDDLAAFENQSIRTVIIKNWESEQYLYSVFLRINTGSVQLSPQELRQALHPGFFSDFVDEYSIQSQQIQTMLGLQEPDFRMRDAELLVRYFAYKNFSDQYDGSLKNFLDNCTESFNARWEQEEELIRQQAWELDRAIEHTSAIFGEHYMKKWADGRYERRVNRAVYDIMVYYFSDQEARDVTAPHAAGIRQSFEVLCQ